MEFRTQRKNAAFSVGDIYLGVVRRVRDNHNAAFVDVGDAREGFLHMKEVGGHYAFMLEGVKGLLREPSADPARKGATSEDAPSEEAVDAAVKQLHFTREIADTWRKKGPVIKRDTRISSVVHPNHVVLVQVAREAIGTKGPSLTTDLSLAGHNLVLLPFGTDVFVSSRITDKSESVRLQRLVQSINTFGYGVVIRTAAMGKNVETLHSELIELVERWRECVSTLLARGPIPRVLLTELANSTALLRDNLNTDYSMIQVNCQSFYTELRDYLESIAPRKGDCVKYYNSRRVPIFDHFGVTRQLKRLLGRTVPFHKGSYLIVEHTEALHVIDVNSGRGAKKAENPEETAFEVNRAACVEIARQLRLRDMGGIIVLDLIDMNEAAHRDEILAHMRKLMKSDKVTHKILPITDFGLMQITRQRVRPEQDLDTSEKCPCCNGTGRVEATVLLEEEIEGRLAMILEQTPHRRLEVRTHPYVAAYFNAGFLSPRFKMARRLKCSLTVKAVSSYAMLEYRFFKPDGSEVTL